MLPMRRGAEAGVEKARALGGLVGAAALDRHGWKIQKSRESKNNKMSTVNETAHPVTLS